MNQELNDGDLVLFRNSIIPSESQSFISIANDRDIILNQPGVYSLSLFLLNHRSNALFQPISNGTPLPGGNFVSDNGALQIMRDLIFIVDPSALPFTLNIRLMSVLGALIGFTECEICDNIGTTASLTIMKIN